MKHAVHIDFMRPARPRGAAIASACVAAGVLAAAALGCWRGEQAIEAEAARLKLVQLARAPAPTLSGADRLLVVQARSIASQLNAPWDELLALFEEHSTPAVGLLKLEPDAKAAIVKVTAQANTAESMVAYLASLEADRRLAEVMLVNHQIERDIEGKPVRFTLLASWRPTALASPSTRPSTLPSTPSPATPPPAATRIARAQP